MRDREIAGLCMTLARDNKMKITVDGEGSYIDLKNNHINIARMPNTPLGTMLVVGLIAHECGHKHHTNVAKPDGIIGTLVNIIEDVRTEALTISERPGTGFNLNAVTKHYIEKGDLAPNDLNHAICGKVLGYGRGVVLNQPTALNLIPVCEEMMDDAFGEEFIRDLDKIIKDMNKLKDTAQVVTMATKIANLIEQQKQNIPPTPQQGEEDETSECQQGGNSQDDGSEGEGEQGEASGAGDDVDEAGDESQAKKGAGKTISQQDIDDILNTQTTYGDVSVMIQQEMDNMMDGDSPMLPLVGKQRHNMGKMDEVTTISASSRMRARMMMMLQDAKRLPVSYGLNGRKIAVNRLERIALGDARIFKKKIEIKALNTAIVIAIDMSGSMESVQHISNPCAFAVHHALFGLGGVAACSIMFRNMHNKSVESVSIVCDFKEKPNSAKFNINPDGSTPTDKAIWFSRTLLLNRPEPRKILLVVTDGVPDDPGQTMQATNRTEKDGIEIACIGIDCDSVARYWKNNRIIKDVKELPKAMFDILDNLLLDKRGYKLEQLQEAA